MADEDFTCDLCPWAESDTQHNATIAAIDESLSRRWTLEVIAAPVLDAAVAPTKPICLSSSTSWESLAQFPCLAAPSGFSTREDAKAAAHEISAASAYHTAQESQWEKAKALELQAMMSCLASKLIDGAGVAVRQRGILGRCCLLRYSTTSNKLSWRSASLELLQLAAVHRSGCTVKLTTSQTSCLGKAQSVRLVLNSELEAVMLDLLLTQLAASAMKTAR
jgi:hypothetical protein